MAVSARWQVSRLTAVISIAFPGLQDPVACRQDDVMEHDRTRWRDRAGVSPASLFNLPLALMDEAQITSTRPSFSDGAAIVAGRWKAAKED
jgi:hypothetical protein